MCFSCKGKSIRPFITNRMTGDSLKFDDQQVDDLRKKFSRMAGNNQVMNVQVFNKNMGILGLQSAQGFSHRLFNSFDIDNDHKISFQDFVEYMEVLKCGNEKNKAKISFKLIDYKNTNKITKDDFRQFLADFFRSWSSITNLPITNQIKSRADQYVNLIFKKVYRSLGKPEIDFKDREFMEAFQFITNGVGGLFLVQNGKIKKQKDLIATENTKKIMKVFQNVQKIYDNVFGKNQKTQFPIINDQQYPKIIPTFIPKICKLNNRKQIFNHTQQNTSVKKNADYYQINFDLLSNKSNKSSSQHKTSDQCHNPQCKANIKKLQYLHQQLKRVIAENEQLKNKISDQIGFNQVQASKIVQRRDVANNVHITSSNANVQQLEEITSANHKKQHTKSTAQLFHYKKNPQGKMVFLGDDNWNMVLNMMIGIQMAVRSMKGYTQIIYQQPKDFNLRYYFQLVPRRFGDQDYTSTIYSFTDFAPNTFNHIRRIFKIDNEDYINSIGPNRLMAALMLGQMSSMTQLTSSGKSGSFFYYTSDGKYMLKTIKERQYRFLKSILKDYYYYLSKNPKSLITKFFGLHKLCEKDQQGNFIRKLYFVIMANVFNTKQKIIERYDIKGSWYGRENHDPQYVAYYRHPNATKKDNDFKKRPQLLIPQKQKDQLINIIRNDSQFFQQHNIIDYSLLIGVVKGQSYEPKNSQVRFSRIEPQCFRETIFYEGKQQKYLFGIIDILTEYDSKKAMEYCFKKLFYGQGISAIPPPQYAARFNNFIEETVFRRQIMKLSVQKITYNKKKQKIELIKQNSLKSSTSPYKVLQSRNS